MYIIESARGRIYLPDNPALPVLEASAHFAVDEPGRLTFTIPATHPASPELQPFDLVELYDLKTPYELLPEVGLIFRGRVINLSRNIYNDLSVEVEGDAARFNDTFIPPFNFPDDFLNDPGYQAAAASGNVVKILLSWMVSQHNSQTKAGDYIEVGNVSVQDPNNYITRASEKVEATWEALEDKFLKSSLGGHFVFRYSYDSTVIDYIAGFTDDNAQRVEYGVNLLDITVERACADLYTAIVPVGKDGLTIKDIPDGAITGHPQLIKSGYAVRNTALEYTYSQKIARIMTWDDVSVAANLQRKAAELLEYEEPPVITLQAIDRHCLDFEVPRFEVGKALLVDSRIHGIYPDTYLPLLSLDVDLLDPAGGGVTVGTEAQSLTGIIGG